MCHQWHGPRYAYHHEQHSDHAVQGGGGEGLRGMNRPWSGLTIIAFLLAVVTLTLSPSATAAPVDVVRPGDIVVGAAGEHEGEAMCTLGFVGKLAPMEGADNPEPERIGVAAGHCFKRGAVIYLSRGDQRIPIGTVIARQREPWVDNPSDTVKTRDMSGFTLIALTSSIGASATTSYGPLVGTDSTVHQGEELCHIGAVSGFRCGPVVNVTTERVDVEAAVEKGDSGGPVVRVARDQDGRSRLTLVGIQVAAFEDRGVLSFNPWSNLAHNLDATIGPGWKYFYSSTA